MEFDNLLKSAGITESEDKQQFDILMTLIMDACKDQLNDKEVNKSVVETLKLVFTKERDYLDKLYRFNMSCPDSDYTKEELEAIWDRKNFYDSLVIAIEEHS